MWIAVLAVMVMPGQVVPNTQTLPLSSYAILFEESTKEAAFAACETKRQKVQGFDRIAVCSDYKPSRDPYSGLPLTNLALS